MRDEVVRVVHKYIDAVRRRDDARFELVTRAEDLGPFDIVINALWEGRPVVDASLGVLPPNDRLEGIELKIALARFLNDRPPAR